MNFETAWEDASATITLLALLPAFVLLFVMSRNTTNTEFDMPAAFETGVLLIVDALLPALGVTLVLALFLYVAANASGMSFGR